MPTLLNPFKIFGGGPSPHKADKQIIISSPANKAKKTLKTHLSSPTRQRHPRYNPHHQPPPPSLRRSTTRSTQPPPPSQLKLRRSATPACPQVLPADSYSSSFETNDTEFDETEHSSQFDSQYDSQCTESQYDHDDQSSYQTDDASGRSYGTCDDTFETHDTYGTAVTTDTCGTAKMNNLTLADDSNDVSGSFTTVSTASMTSSAATSAATSASEYDFYHPYDETPSPSSGGNGHGGKNGNPVLAGIGLPWSPPKTKSRNTYVRDDETGLYSPSPPPSPDRVAATSSPPSLPHTSPTPVAVVAPVQPSWREVLSSITCGCSPGGGFAEEDADYVVDNADNIDGLAMDHTPQQPTTAEVDSAHDNETQTSNWVAAEDDFLNGFSREQYRLAPTQQQQRRRQRQGRTFVT